MGTCYTYLIQDDFDWGYTNTTKAEAIEKLKEIFYCVEVKGQWYGWIVFYADKFSPWREGFNKIWSIADAVYYYTDHNETIVKLNRPHDKVIDPVEFANRPANRNKKEIDQAFADWLERYKNDK